MWNLFSGRRKAASASKAAAEPAARPTISVPPITDEEKASNLSELERRLNREMKCPAGKNQVFLRSVLTERGTTPPRIALKCTYRRDIQLHPIVHYEHIRDVCCCDPEKCEAYRAFKRRFMQT
jgi:hypothetical protein